MIPSALETEWAERLAELIQPFKPAALILQVPSTGALANLLANAQAAELAVLFVDAVHQTREMGANGVYLSTPGSGISNVRRELGASSIIGAACGLSRHVAMETAEAGADFVAFDASSPENMPPSLRTELVALKPKAGCRDCMLLAVWCQHSSESVKIRPETKDCHPSSLAGTFFFPNEKPQIFQAIEEK